MIVLGLLLGLVGTDVNSGVARFSFDIPELTDGIGFVVIAMGVFATVKSSPTWRGRRSTVRSLRPRCRACGPPKRTSRTCSLRCCAAPRWGRRSAYCLAGGALLASFAAYALEKKGQVQAR